MREKLVVELVKEVLGPRKGPREILNDNPLNEYITGVLAPVLDISARRTAAEIESEAELPVEDTQSYEEEMEDVDIHVPPMLHPALNPKNRPSTIGLSFVAEAAGKPVIDVCLTWARYRELRIGKLRKRAGSANHAKRSSP